MTDTPILTALARGVLFAVLLVAACFVLDWSENRSPWAIERQKAKVIAMKRTYCNDTQ